MEYKIGEQFCPDRKLSVVVDQSEFPELVHEVRDPCPGRTHHFRQGFMTRHGQFRIRDKFMFPQSRQLQEDASQPLFAVIEQLVAEVLFEIDVSGQQRRDELFGKLRLLMKRAEHR